MLGSEYVIDHCICALKERRSQEAFRSYIADSAMYINQSIAKTLGGTYLEKRYSDLFKAEREDERTGDEIALEVIRKAGLKVRQE